MRGCGIVVKGRFRPVFTDGIGWDYFIVEDIRSYFGFRKVSQSEAEDYIEGHGLVPALETEDGIVWDVPGGAFRKASLPVLGGLSRERLWRLHKRWDEWMG